MPVRVSGDTSTAAGWRFERCSPLEPVDEGGGGSARPPRPDGHVIELAGVSLERYAEFVRSACTYRG